MIVLGPSREREGGREVGAVGARESRTPSGAVAVWNRVPIVSSATVRSASLIGEGAQALDPLAAGALDPRQHGLAGAPHAGRRPARRTRPRRRRAARSSPQRSVRAFEQLVAIGGHDGAKAAEQGPLLKRGVEERCSRPSIPTSGLLIEAEVAQDEARPRLVAERFGVEAIEERRVGGVVLDHGQRLPVEPVCPRRARSPRELAATGSPPIRASIGGSSAYASASNRRDVSVCLRGAPTESRAPATARPRSPARRWRRGVWSAGREVDEGDRRQPGGEHAARRSAPARRQPDGGENAEDDGDVSAVMADEPVLEQREGEHGEQHRDRDPRRAARGRARPGGTAAAVATMTASAAAQSQPTTPVLDLHRPLVAGDDLERGADVVVEVAEPLAGRSNQSAAKQAANEVASRARLRAREPGSAITVIATSSEDGDADVELDQRLDRGEDAAAVEEQRRGPGTARPPAGRSGTKGRSARGRPTRRWAASGWRRRARAAPRAANRSCARAAHRRLAASTARRPSSQMPPRAACRPSTTIGWSRNPSGP